MRIRPFTAVVLAAAALTGGAATAASASSSSTPSNLPFVTITHYDNGTQISTGVPGQPLFSASVDDRGICGGFSYEEGFCIPVTTG